jgi:hypothetical protein
MVINLRTLWLVSWLLNPLNMNFFDNDVLDKFP